MFSLGAVISCWPRSAIVETFRAPAKDVARIGAAAISPVRSPRPDGEVSGDPVTVRLGMPWDVSCPVPPGCPQIAITL